MQNLYSRPLRVYLLLGALALWGVFSGLNLSISLFPMSNQAQVSVELSYGSYSSQQFFDSVGRELEPLFQGSKAEGVPVDKITATYGEKSVRYKVTFDWGANPDEAVKVIQNAAIAKLSRFESGIRDSLQVHSWNSGGGAFFVSFYSPLRSLDEVYQILEPLISPLSSKIPDAGNFGLWNPNQKEITIRLSPEKLAQNRLTTRHVESAITDSIFAFSGGTLQLGEKQYQVSMPRKAAGIEQLQLVRVSPVGQDPVLLKDVAQLEVAVTQESAQRFRTSGVESLILFSMPKEGGNVKRMSDDIMRHLAATSSQWPKDIQFNVLVNPSETINRSISGVLKEVGIAAFLAVLVLFFFIGSFRNVVTAAIEIPLSLLMAFILMKLSGMNLNLISLGGLALSAGMNVDASVVVLENIFRHFEGKPKGMSFEEKTKIVVGAVKEVQLPIIASTLASLVVFLPLVFTRGLTNSLLGDLAKAVLFSHGLSAIVALVLVPTIRLQLLKNGEMGHGESRFEPFLRGMESLYGRVLRRFLVSTPSQLAALAGVAAALPLLILLVVPNLKKEVIGKPESDWLIVGLNSPLSTSNKQIDSEIEALEADVKKQFGDEILYTFSQIHGTSNGNVMIRLRDRSKVEALIAKGEEIYKNTPTKYYFVVSWSPSELRIPEAVDFRLEVTGGTSVRRQQVAHDLNEILSDPSLYDNLSVTPNTVVQKGLLVLPILNLTAQPEVLSRYDLSHFLRVATDGIYVDKIFDRNSELPIYLRMPRERSTSVEGISSLPIGFDGRLVPVGALARVSIQEKEPPIYRENLQAMNLLEATLKKVNSRQAPERLKTARAALADYRAKLEGEKNPAKRADNPVLVEGQGDKVLQEALAQLKWAVLISIALIFLTMVLQLGDVVHSLLVLVAIPLGIIGVIVSLAVFGSTLSLNSGLGTILLNGIAVANSIILVDFIRRQSEAGMGALDAVVTASQARLRPILMTSLCTVLGMFPIALGHGEGGKTLQPLGIAVSGGLWISMSLTIFLVPALQFQYLRWKEKRARRAGGIPVIASLLLVFLFSPVAQAAPAASETRQQFLADLDLFRQKALSLTAERAKLDADGTTTLSRLLQITPSVTGAIGKTETRINNDLTGRGKSIHDYWRLSGNWNLFRGLGDYHAWQAARNSESAQGFQVRSEELRIELEGAKVIFNRLHLRDVKAAQDELLKLKQETLRLGRSRYSQGKIPLQDVTKMEVDLSQQANVVRQAEIELAQNEVAYKAFFVDGLKTQDWPLTEAQGLALSEGTGSFALKRLHARASSFEHSWKSGRSRHLPSLDLSLSYQELPFRRPNTKTWSGTLELSIPLWSRFEISAAAAQSYAGFVEAESAAAAAEREDSLRREFVKKKTTLSYAAIREARLNLEKSDRLYRDMLRSFQLGRLSTNDLFLEQNRKIDSLLSYTRSRLSFHESLMDACALWGLDARSCLR